jgi:hypothetical protein
MTPYITQGGLIGFLLVLSLNIFNDNGIGISVVRACIAAVAFAYCARWFAGSLFSELHLSLWLQQQAAAQAAQEMAEVAAPETVENQETEAAK